MVTIKWRFAVELPAHKAFDRRWEKEEESWCSCDEDACHERTRRAGRGAVDQKFVKYLSESSNFVKKTPTLFSFEILGNEMRDSQLCKVYSSGGTFCFRTSSRKYRRSKSAPAGFCTLLCDRTHIGECRTKPKKCQFSFLRNRKQSGYFDSALFLEF